MSNLNLQDFRELLPFFINNTLTENERHSMNSFLKQHPECQSEVDFIHVLQQTVKSVGNARAADAGLQELRQAINNSQGNSLMNWIRDTKINCLNWGATPAFVGMTLVVIFQGAMLWGMHKIDYKAQSILVYRGDSRLIRNANIKITVNQSAGLNNLLELLQRNDAYIVNGPSKNGELWISLDDINELDNVVQQLRNTDGVIDVMIIV